MQHDDHEKSELPYEISGKDAFEVQVGLLNGLHVRKENHTYEAGDKCPEHIVEVVALVQPGAEPLAEKKDQQNEDPGDRGIDQQGGGSYGRSLVFVLAGAYEADMRIFQQAALGGFKDSGYDEEQGPGTHLAGWQATDEDDVIDETEENDGKSLQNRIKRRTDPV